MIWGGPALGAAQVPHLGCLITRCREHIAPSLTPAGVSAGLWDWSACCLELSEANLIIPQSCNRICLQAKTKGSGGRWPWSAAA